MRHKTEFAAKAIIVIVVRNISFIAITLIYMRLHISCAQFIYLTYSNLLEKPDPKYEVAMRIINQSLLLIALSFTGALSASDIDLGGRPEADMERDKSSHPAKIIEFAGVKSGDKVLDFFGGGGYYTEILSRVVGPQGEVVLHNNQGFLNYVSEQLEVRLKDNRLENVTRLDSEADDLKLGEAEFDYAFIVLGLHDMYYKDKGWDIPVDSVLNQIRESLKPGGKLLIIDHNSKPGSGVDVSKTLHRMEDNYAKMDIEKNGFILASESKLLRNPEDDMSMSVFAPEMRRKTDRFVYLFEVAKQ